MRVRPFLARAAILCLAAMPVGLAQAPAGDRPLFRFQSNFWVNLHHFVRADSRRRSIPGAPLLPLSELSADERASWNAALDAYANLAKANLVFDERLIALNNALSALGDSPALPPGTVEPKIAAALNGAAPVYRAHLWEHHRRDNERWIAGFRPLVEHHAAAVTKALAAAYHVTWPSAPILVDLSCDAGPNLAYTTGGPPGTSGHTVIAPLQAADRDVGFEIVFHEASHTVDDQIVKTLDAEAARQHVGIPTDLWHAVIFFTSGEVVKRELGKQGDPSYKPYAYRFDLYGKTAKWDLMRAALERDWQPYLEGKSNFETAIRDLVHDAGR
jgi:hypothetical protein